jgi:hypothetical protein
MQIVFAAILSIGLLLVINFSGRIARGQQMEVERRRLQATIDVLEMQQLDLLKARDYAANDASVEHWAHTEGKMVRDGEVLVIRFVQHYRADAGSIRRSWLPRHPRTKLRTGSYGGISFDGEPPF